MADVPDGVCTRLYLIDQSIETDFGDVGSDFADPGGFGGDWSGTGQDGFCGGFSAGDHFSSDPIAGGTSASTFDSVMSNLTPDQQGSIFDVLNSPPIDLDDGNVARDGFQVYVDADNNVQALGNQVFDAAGNPVVENGVNTYTLPGAVVSASSADFDDVPAPWDGTSRSSPELTLFDRIGRSAGRGWEEFTDKILPALGPETVMVKDIDLLLASGLATVRIGAQGERRVREVYDIGESRLVAMDWRFRRPDGFIKAGTNGVGGVISEVKNVAYQAFTRQLRAYAAWAQEHGYVFNLYVRENRGTDLSRQLQQAVNDGAINIRYIP